MMDNLVIVEELKRNFGRVEAVNGLNLKAEKGSITGLLGPNGAGKTTTLHILMSILRRDSGKVLINGHDPDKDPVKIKESTVFFMENPQGEPRFNIREQLNFHKSFRSNWDTSFEKELLSLFRLKESKPINALSRGEQAKLALICALAFKPELLILDDPTSGLDPLARREFVDGIIKILSEEGCTVLFSTHIVDDIERIADNIVMMQNGRDIMSGSLEDIHNDWCSFRLFFENSDAPENINVPGIYTWKPLGREGIAVFKKYTGESEIALKEIADHIKPFDLSLEDIYLEIVRSNNTGDEK